MRRVAAIIGCLVLGGAPALVARMRAEGFTVSIAAGVEAALALLRGTPPPRFILLGLFAPSLDPMEFRRGMMQNPGLAAIPVGGRAKSVRPSAANHP